MPDSQSLKVRYVGLDVHKRVIQACILAPDGEIVFSGRLSIEALQKFAQEFLQPLDQVVLEATTNTWAIAERLAPHVAEVVISNPLTTKAIATAKIKTDKVDALVLAQLLRCDYLPRVWQPDPQTRELRRLTSRRAGLVSDRTRIKNRLHSVLAQRLIAPPKERLFTPDGLHWLREVELDPEGRLMLDSDLRLLEAVEAEIARFDQLLAEKGHHDQRVKLLMTLPGVNVTVAQTLIAALGDITRFTDGDHAASYLGLVPSTRQSGDHCYHGPITKAGRGHARWMLIQAAQHVRHHAGPLGVFFQRLAGKKNYNVAVVAAARKLVVIAWHMLTNHEPYRYAQPRLTQEKLAKLRIKAAGQRRRTGPAKGTKCAAKLPGGSRTIKPLTQVYQEEGLPELRLPKPAELRFLRHSGIADYAASLARQRVVPRRQSQAAPNT